MKNSVKIVRFWSRIECSRILEKNLEFENSNNCFISTEMVCFFFFLTWSCRKWGFKRLFLWFDSAKAYMRQQATGPSLLRTGIWCFTISPPPPCSHHDVHFWLQGHRFPVGDVAWNHGENLLATSDLYGIVIVWKREKTSQDKYKR